MTRKQNLREGIFLRSGSGLRRDLSALCDACQREARQRSKPNAYALIITNEVQGRAARRAGLVEASEVRGRRRFHSPFCRPKMGDAADALHSRAASGLVMGAAAHANRGGIDPQRRRRVLQPHGVGIALDGVKSRRAR
jgi:hypothetical protein